MMQLVLWDRAGAKVAELAWRADGLHGEVEFTSAENGHVTRFGLTDALHAGMCVMLGRRRFHYLEDPQ